MKVSRRYLGRDAAHLAHDLDIALGEVGLKLGEYRVLGELGNGAKGNAELARAIGVTPATTSATVNSLVRKGLIARRRSTRDRRRIMLRLTPSGDLALHRADRLTEQCFFILEAMIADARAQSDLPSHQGRGEDAPWPSAVTRLVDLEIGSSEELHPCEQAVADDSSSII